LSFEEAGMGMSQISKITFAEMREQGVRGHIAPQ
jgi:hypothetical protein